MFIVQVLAVAFIVAFFGSVIYMGSEIDKSKLKIEIMRRQKALEKPIFDDVDFEKYHSFKELSRLNE